MRAFVCQRCRHLVRFEALHCVSCGALTGFDALDANLETLGKSGEDLVPWTGDSCYGHGPGCDIPGSVATSRPPGDSSDAGSVDAGSVDAGSVDAGSLGPRPTGAGSGGPAGCTRRWRRCARWQSAQCNWLVDADSPEQLCSSCRLTRTVPPRPNAAYRAALAKAELAKRRLLFQLGQLKLPVVSRGQDPKEGLAFDLLAGDRHVVTGHDNGIITIDLNETDDVFREQARAQFGEPYRTLLGHFRHEIGHYYWRRLVAGPNAPQCFTDEAQSLFGDDRCGYEDARRKHYTKGPRPGWEQNHVSAYASMHPLEDWAETFAHYLHIWDTVQTAASFGVLVTGPVDDRTGRRDPANASVPSEDTAALEGFGAVIADWRPLTLALNALNRSLGKDDLYPFDLSPAVVAKLAFVHKVITSAPETMKAG